MGHNVPIPFKDRLPEPKDCDKEGNFWSGRQTVLGWRWIVDCNPSGAMSDGFTHWLPFRTQWLPAHPSVYKPEPVLVSERMPEEEDCDDKGRCWVGYGEAVDEYDSKDQELNPSWELCKVHPQDEFWLPAHSLPIPPQL